MKKNLSAKEKIVSRAKKEEDERKFTAICNQDPDPSKKFYDVQLVIKDYAGDPLFKIQRKNINLSALQFLVANLEDINRAVDLEGECDASNKVGV